MSITSLDQELKRAGSLDFPSSSKTNYPKTYEYLLDFLEKKVYPHLVGLNAAKEGGYLTDHGIDHIRTVGQRASELLANSPKAISPYEKYLLLVAICFHDIANASGRELHELRSEQYMQELSLLMGDDKAEQRMIYMIAQAHGGYTTEKSKDKISELPPEEPLLSQKVRPRFLAALLRFADELADDRSRSVRFKPLTSLIPKSSEVFHAYATSLHSVMISAAGSTISLHFDMQRGDAVRKFGKGSGEVFLLDEIYDRSLKMHTERLYCMRFLRPIVSIDKVIVDIKTFGQGYLEELAHITYRLEESGYPDAAGTSFFEVCKDLRSPTEGDHPTGQKLREFLESGKSGETM